MDALRELLHRLGWPIQHLSDDEILLHMHRRWFGLNPDCNPSETQYNLASAMGIASALAREGNLDALCWADDLESDPEPVALDDDFDCFDPLADQSPVEHERRRAPRRKAKDFVVWSATEGDDEAEETGWLVCQAEGGLAFIAPMNKAPLPGRTVSIRIHSRKGDTFVFSRAQVVRQEFLSDKFALVCVEVVQEARPQGL